MASFSQLSPILTVRGALYRIKGRIYKDCVQSALTYGTETWAMIKGVSMRTAYQYEDRVRRRKTPPSKNKPLFGLRV